MPHVTVLSHPHVCSFCLGAIPQVFLLSTDLNFPSFYVSSTVFILSSHLQFGWVEICRLKAHSLRSLKIFFLLVSSAAVKKFDVAEILVSSYVLAFSP